MQISYNVNNINAYGVVCKCSLSELLSPSFSSSILHPHFRNHPSPLISILSTQKIARVKNLKYISEVAYN